MFTIIVVCYNPGEKLKKTLDSIYSQTYTDIRVIIKDGASQDGALEELEKTGYFDNRVRTDIYSGRDSGIYDAMNRAVELSGKEKNWNYYYFLNCGDYLYDSQVLYRTAAVIEEAPNGKAVDILYGNLYNRSLDTIVSSSKSLGEWDLFRNVPCHQVCFYNAALMEPREELTETGSGYVYDNGLRVRADYEHFLYCMYEKKAAVKYMNIVVVSYEGEGFSETKENIARSREEHKLVTNKYMGKKAILYRLVMVLSGGPIRSRMAGSKALAPAYNKIKSFIYNKRIK